MTRRHSSGVMSRNRWRMLMPALAITTSTPPRSRSTSANAASTDGSVGDVRGNDPGQAGQLSAHAGEPILVEVQDHHAAALGDEPCGGGQPDAARPAGDDDPAPGEIRVASQRHGRRSHRAPLAGSRAAAWATTAILIMLLLPLGFPCHPTARVACSHGPPARELAA